MEEQVFRIRAKLKKSNIVLNPKQIKEHTGFSSTKMDILIVDFYTLKPVFLELSDNDHLLGNLKVLTHIVDSMKLDRITKKTIDRKRVLIGRFYYRGYLYGYCAIKDLGFEMQLLIWITSFIFSTALIGFCWNFFHTRKIINNLLKGIYLITDSARSIKANNLQNRIQSNSSHEGINNLTNTLNFMLDEVEKSFIKINDFTSNVSHELKTPLASIKNLIEVELMKERTKEEYQDDLSKILDEVSWLNDIINKLLTFTKNPDDIIKQFKPVDIKELLLKDLEFFEILALEKNITITYDFDFKNINVLGDYVLIKDIFTNLVSNAIKYNKINGSIHIQSRIIRKKLCLSFKDTGVGISKENISKVTERFYREDTVRTPKKSGSGLGLSIVSHLLELHNGKLIVKSIKGKGSSFTTVFPILLDEERKG